MPYTDYLTPERITFLKSETKEEAFAELVNLICLENPALKFNQILNEIWERENLVTTKVAEGIAIPHAKLQTLKDPIIVVGKSNRGIFYDVGDQKKVYLLIMILSDNEKYLSILSGIAAKLNENEAYRKIISAKTANDIYDLLTTSTGQAASNQDRLKVSQSIFCHACELFKEFDAKAILLYADAIGDVRFLLAGLGGEKVYLITHNPEKYKNIKHIKNMELIQVPFEGLSRTGQIEISQLFVAAKGFLKKGDKVISVYGKRNSGVFDAVMITDIESEFSSYFSFEPQVLPPDLKQEVFARAIQLASDLAYEGREGKPVGTIFVLGDHENAMNYSQQMVVNPFKGLRDDERNILDPSLEETVKEFSKLDGAFIISGDGLIITSGAYLSTHTPTVDFLQGLGARHAAAASITSATNSLAVVISESTRKVSIFKAGKRFIVF